MSFSALFNHLGDNPVVILDGGMGTTLQAPPFNLGLDSALWSSELLKTEQGLAMLQRLHATWIEHGAEIIGTCTYQSSLPFFLPSQPASTSGAYTQEEFDNALRTMLAALPAAHSVALPKSSRMPHGRALSCLSLGPYGAQLQPGQEYAGLYPPPFGTGPSPSKPGFSLKAADACPLPLHELVSSGADPAEDALAAFHLQRLRHFASDRSNWDALGMLAFETVPVIREARAARRAMTTLSQSGSSPAPTQKPFILSFVFPLDEEVKSTLCPDPELKAQGVRSLSEHVERIVAAAFDGPEARPAGLGINCTNPRELRPIIEALSQAVGRRKYPADNQPWLVLYPDGGSVYDVFTKTWSTPSGLDEQAWAHLLSSDIDWARSLKLQNSESDQKQDQDGGRSIWGGIIAGGCCKAGPEAIRALRDLCEARGWIQ